MPEGRLVLQDVVRLGGQVTPGHGGVDACDVQQRAFRAAQDQGEPVIRGAPRQGGLAGLPEEQVEFRDAVPPEHVDGGDVEGAGEGVGRRNGAIELEVEILG